MAGRKRVTVFSLLRPLLCFALWIVQVDASNVTLASLFGEIFTNYDPRLPPKHYQASGDKHVDIYVNLYIGSMYRISEIGMDYSISMFLRERWMEPRFAYQHLTSDINRIELDVNTHENVWIPDVFIRNEKMSDFHDVTILNKYIHVYPDGTVQYSTRVTGTFACQMNLRKYPFDKQECKLEFESYGHSTENLRLIWLSEAVTVASGIRFPHFTLENFTSYNCDRKYFDIVYPCIGVSFTFVRSYGYYIIQVYVPSFLVVVLSWLNFWLDSEAVPARISMGILTVLTMTAQSVGSRADLPRVSYIKAIDIWMAACLTFVFAALLEFAYVNVLCRKAKRYPSDLYRSEICSRKGFYDLQQIDLPDAPEEKSNLSITLSEVQPKKRTCYMLPCFKRKTGLNNARFVDKISRVLFPLMFLMFNIIYWILYICWIPD